MGFLGKKVKQPGETLDYDVDFTDWFSTRADAPSSFTVTADTGITEGTHVLNGNVVKVWLSGGTDGQQYQVNVKMTTTSGAVKEADFIVKVKAVGLG